MDVLSCTNCVPNWEDKLEAGNPAITAEIPHFSHPAFQLANTSWPGKFHSYLHSDCAKIPLGKQLGCYHQMEAEDVKGVLHVERTMEICVILCTEKQGMKTGILTT